MAKTFKRAYIEKGWWNSLVNRFVENEYSVSITKVIITEDENGINDENEDQLDCFGGFKSVEEIKEFLKENYKIKEIIEEDE